MSYLQYTTTALEDWVSDFYKELKINHPIQINEEFISWSNRIFLHRKPRYGNYEIVGQYRGITVDSRESLEKQREMFFHELCHLLRHTGIQSMMHTAFRELQERDAEHFKRYAAIPFHMLKYIDIQDPYVIDQMVDLFKVTPELCELRLLQIKNRMNMYKVCNVAGGF
ncbi:ImmA/IrrE family metallo-endopeptidase [Peribacillus frigoritolerans]|uniref:ImmA/IrrE family metallo-endopeptidase n=1 Tax=Peribacillus frigoritolerans TaxID=450367 RepID=UPI0007BF4C9E